MTHVLRTARRQARLACCLALTLTSATLLPLAQAGVIGAEAVARSAASPESPQGRLLATLDRAEVTQALTQRGVDPVEARARVTALSDDQAQALLAQVDAAPAGAGGIIETAVFIFLVLLATDILGFTKVFPFTRAIR